jgi:hypothetical protein
MNAVWHTGKYRKFKSELLLFEVRGPGSILARSHRRRRRLRSLTGKFQKTRIATRRSELRQISLHVWPPAQVRQRFLQNPGSRVIEWHEKAIVHPPALAPCSDDARATQISQVAGDFRLAHSEDADEVADADLLVGDKVQQTKARGIGEGAKEKIEWK